MQAIENASLIDGRDEIIKDLKKKWNGEKKLETQTPIIKKKKKNRESISLNEELDVPLI